MDLIANCCIIEKTLKKHQRMDTPFFADRNQEPFRTRTAWLQKVKAITFEAVKGHHITLYLFGSWARNQEKVSSDIDLAIDYSLGSLPPGTLANMRLAFEESTIPYQVDLVDLTMVDDQKTPVLDRSAYDDGTKAATHSI
jgi:predicted nucleotidyltransferase